MIPLKEKHQDVLLLVSKEMLAVIETLGDREFYVRDKTDKKAYTVDSFIDRLKNEPGFDTARIVNTLECVLYDLWKMSLSGELTETEKLHGWGIRRPMCEAYQDCLYSLGLAADYGIELIMGVGGANYLYLSHSFNAMVPCVLQQYQRGERDQLIYAEAGDTPRKVARLRYLDREDVIRKLQPVSMSDVPFVYVQVELCDENGYFPGDDGYDWFFVQPEFLPEVN